jgi:glycerol-3-phosphate acyltransferase PlsY
MTPWLLLIAAYFAGSLPIGLLVAKLWKGIDVREHGSGNSGATNVFRVVGPVAGSIVFALDVLKGLWPPLAAHAMGHGSGWQVAAGMAAILGHNFSPFLGFKGGKGIATSLGVLFGVSPLVGVTALALWVVVVLASRYVSLGSILAAASLAPLMLLFYPGQWTLFGFGLVAGLVAIYKHRANIDRLLKGTENRFGKRGTADGETDGETDGEGGRTGGREEGRNV